MDPWIQTVLTIFASILASSGFWTYLQRKSDKKDGNSEMLIGLGHDRIIYLGNRYIERGWITLDEYENIKEYLWGPYDKIGGNGSASRIMREVDKLPIKKNNYKEEK